MFIDLLKERQNNLSCVSLPDILLRIQKRNAKHNASFARFVAHFPKQILRNASYQYTIC